MTEFLAYDGAIVIACPHFLNPRGYGPKHWAYGPRLLKDFDKQLHTALRDVRLPTGKVEDYMQYLKKLVQYLETVKRKLLK